MFQMMYVMYLDGCLKGRANRTPKLKFQVMYGTRHMRKGVAAGHFGPGCSWLDPRHVDEFNWSYEVFLGPWIRCVDWFMHSLAFGVSKGSKH